MYGKIYKLLSVSILFVLISANAQEVTTLLCQGAGSVLESQVSNQMEYDEKSLSYTKTNTTSTTDHPAFSGVTNLEIFESTVRMKFPHSLYHRQ